MNRAERRRKQAAQGGRLDGAIQSAMEKEIRRQCLAADAALALDVDTVVLWTLHTHLGFGRKRLRAFYEALAAEHRRMRERYETGELYPERARLKAIGVDVEAWEKEIL